MQLFRNIVNRTAILGLGFFVVLIIPLIVFMNALTNQTTVKQWLVDAEVYPLATEQIYQEAREEATKSQQNVKQLRKNGFFNEEQLFETISTVLDETFIQEQSERVIDGIYGWLEGKTPAPEYTVSLKEKWPETSQALKDELLAQYELLPLCGLGQTLPPKTDISKVVCRIPGRDVTPQINAFIDSFVKQDNQIATGEWKGSDLLASESNPNGLQQADLDKARSAYTALSVLPLVSIVAAVIGVIIIVATAKTWRSGLKVVGGTFVVAGILLGLYALVLGSLDIVGMVFKQGVDSDSVSDISKTILASLIETAFGTVSATSMKIAGIVIAVGLLPALVLWLLSFRGRNTHAVENTNPMSAPSVDGNPSVIVPPTSPSTPLPPPIAPPAQPGAVIPPKPPTPSVDGVAQKPRKRIQ